MKNSINEFSKTIISIGTSPSIIDGPNVTIKTNGVSLSSIYIINKLPEFIKYRSIDKLYWQNDVDGVNEMLTRTLEMGKALSVVKVVCSEGHDIEHMMDVLCRWLPGEFDIVESINASTLERGDVIIAFDEEDDLVRAVI